MKLPVKKHLKQAMPIVENAYCREDARLLSEALLFFLELSLPFAFSFIFFDRLLTFSDRQRHSTSLLYSPPQLQASSAAHTLRSVLSSGYDCIILHHAFRISRCR